MTLFVLSPLQELLVIGIQCPRSARRGESFAISVYRVPYAHIYIYIYALCGAFAQAIYIYARLLFSDYAHHLRRPLCRVLLFHLFVQSTLCVCRGSAQSTSSILRHCSLFDCQLFLFKYCQTAQHLLPSIQVLSTSITLNRFFTPIKVLNFSPYHCHFLILVLLF